MCISHVPNMCRVLDVPLYIKPLLQCAEALVTALILQTRLKLSELSLTARFAQVASQPQALVLAPLKHIESTSFLSCRSPHM